MSEMFVSNHIFELLLQIIDDLLVFYNTKFISK